MALLPTNIGKKKKALQVIEYGLQRNILISRLKKGHIRILDVCDANPELLRAAKNLGKPSGENCPVCDEAALVFVTYGFGSRLPKGGLAISDQNELQLILRRVSDLSLYEVEVCTLCRWNHLVKIIKRN